VLVAKEGVEFIFAGEELCAQRLRFRMHVVEQCARGGELVGREPEFAGADTVASAGGGLLK
jgi:hypothetical protein